jgi:hypothetical protein
MMEKLIDTNGRWPGNIDIMSLAMVLMIGGISGPLRAFGRLRSRLSIRTRHAITDLEAEGNSDYQDHDAEHDG